jgi:hypothetical protein
MRTWRILLSLAIGLCLTAANFADETKSATNSPAALIENHARLRETSFQQGVHGYLGTVDTEIWALASKTILDKNPNASSDGNNDGGESQVVMRFDNIFGNSERQIPLGSTIVSAKLIVAAFDQGSTVNLHRLLVPFGKHATWDSLISGVSADGYEASRHKDGFTFGKIAASTSGAIFDVTDTVQIWSLGKPNHGWIFLNTGGNGWDFYTAEFDKIEQRPKLVVKYIPPTKSKAASLVVEQSAAVGSSGSQ